MTETETEAQTLERLETALKRIGDLARHPRPAAGETSEIDREEVLHSLDRMIHRLRNGLELPTVKPEIDGVDE